MTRRRFAAGAGSTAAAMAAGALLPAWARAATGLATSRPNPPAAGGVTSMPAALDAEMDLAIARRSFHLAGRQASAVTIDGTVPGPVVRLREGGTATLRVHNRLDEPTSIHWHGLILPPEMDGVPGVSFAGIAPGTTFEYRFPVRQAGTYWYHSHSGLQEQLGHYAPLIIDPAEADPFEFDRDHVIMLGDWTFEDPYKVLARLKKQANYYNHQRRTLPGLFEEASDMGLGGALADRLMWGRMRMDSTDLADVTGSTYSFLMNGRAPADNWTGLFAADERVRLRLINAAAATTFDVRIPGLRLTVVQADGQNVVPVTVDELRIGIAETYDVIVEPAESTAYTIFAEAMDRSGYARGTLAPREGMTAETPARRTRALRTMADMGMAGMHGGHGAIPEAAPDEPMAAMTEGPETRHAMAGEHGGHMMPPEQEHAAMAAAPEPIPHGRETHGAGSAGVAMRPVSRLHEPGIGLGSDGRRVLVYADLKALAPLYDHRPPDRELELHATGNMERYMWSFDGKKFSQVHGPIPFIHGERLRLNFVNDTMMEHPLHLHGMWMHLDTGNGALNPRKHTLNLKPGERVYLDVEVDAPGMWAFHCHVLYHMEAGMFRVVYVGDHDLSHEGHDS